MGVEPIALWLNINTQCNKDLNLSPAVLRKHDGYFSARAVYTTALFGSFNGFIITLKNRIVVGAWEGQLNEYLK